MAKPKEELPWAQKSKYQPPTNPMAADTIYHISYPAPGYYVEDVSRTDCPCPNDEQSNALSAPAKAVS